MGDFLAQWLENGRELARLTASEPPDSLAKPPEKTQPRPIFGKYNRVRGLSIFADGILISGPLMHFGYEWFEHILPISGGGIMAALVHVIADTLLLDSIFVATTFWVTGWCEGFSMRQILSQFRRDYFPAVKLGGMTSLLVMPVEIVCFRFLPLSYRVLAVNFIDIVWDGVISYMAHRSRGECEHFHEDTSEGVGGL